MILISKNLRPLWLLVVVACISACKGGTDADASSGPSGTEDPEWVFCAKENAICELNGLHAVRFGSDSVWAVALFDDRANCSAEAFNAAASNVQRHCEYSALEVMPADPISSKGSPTNSSSGVAGTPPHTGTVYLDRDIIRSGDPTTYLNMTYKGTAERRAWHSERSATLTFDAHIFELDFDDGDVSEIAVEDAIGNESLARDEAEKLAIPLGQIPAIMRKAVNSITIFAGTGRGTASVGGLISTYADSNDSKIRDGYLEEFLVHESTHTSLDNIYYTDPLYREAAKADNNFVSTYAQENPTTEDISESMVAYLAVRLRADRISADWEYKIREAMGSRLAFFDRQNLDFYPVHHTSVNVRSQLTMPTKGDTLQSTSETFEWSSTPQASAYDLIVGSLGRGSNNIRESQPVFDTAITLDNLPADGGVVFVRLRTQVDGRWRHEDYEFRGFNLEQTAAQLLTPKAGAMLSSSRLLLSWDRPKGAKRYDLVVGDEGPGSDNIRRSQSLESNSVELLNLPIQSETLYIRLYTENLEWEYRDYTVTAANDSPHARLLSPVEGSSINNTTFTFEWDAPLGASNYDLLIGTAGPGSTDIRASSVLNVNSLQVANLPINGETIYVRLWTFKDGWEFIDYQF